MNLDAALAQRRRMRARRRRLLYLRRALILLVAAALLALMIATPFWIVGAVRSRRARADDSNMTPTPTVTRPTVPEEDPIPAVDADTISLGGAIISEYAALLDMTEGRVVAAKNADLPANPASITKVMTLLVAVENIDDLDTPYTMSWKIIDPPYREGASTTGLETGEVVTLRDLLYGCILPSGADATAALADYVADHEIDYGAEDEAVFAEMMNRRAAQLGATNTHFTNASGLHAREHKTTAMDMALIMAEAMKNPVCRQVLTAREYLIPPTPQHPEGLLQTSTMFRHIGSRNTCIVAGKTGFTDQALNTLVTYTKKDGHEYVFVSMYGNGSDKVLEDTLKVYETYC